MTCKKFWQTKNCIRRECLAGSRPARTPFGGGVAGNPQSSRGAPRKQFEGGIEVPEAALKRLFGNGGVVMEAIKRAHPCVVGVFKKGRPTPLVHIVAFSQHHLDSALRCIKDTLSRPAPRIETLHLVIPSDIFCTSRRLKDEVYKCGNRYAATTLTYDEESETLTIRGPSAQARLAYADIKIELPTNRATQTVFGPAGVLIGSCGATIGTVRETFNVDVTISGDSAIITGWDSHVSQAVAWYEELFRSYKERREMFAAIKAYKKSLSRQSSEATVSSASSAASCSTAGGRSNSSYASSCWSSSREVTEWVW